MSGSGVAPRPDEYRSAQAGDYVELDDNGEVLFDPEELRQDLAETGATDGDDLAWKLRDVINAIPEDVRHRCRRAIKDCTLDAVIERGIQTPTAMAELSSLLAGSLGFKPSDIKRELKQRETKRGEDSYKRADAPSEADMPGEAAVAREIEPWPEPVNGAEVLDDIVAQLDIYLAAPASRKQAVALWCAFTHAINCFPTNPRLLITAPAKRSGKTRLLELLQPLVPRVYAWSNATAATFFRSLGSTPTILLDEGDTFLRSDGELLGALNSGWRRSQASWPRCVGQDNEVRMFTTWAPVALAMIKKPPDALLDRSIVIEMQRRKPTEKINRFRPDKKACSGPLEILGRKLARWVADNARAIQAWDGRAPKILHDRAADNWEPMLAIADVAGGHWPETARRIAAELTGAEADSDDIEVMLLQDISELLGSKGNPEYIASTDITEHLNGLTERPWSEWGKGKGLTTSTLSRKLKAYGIEAKQKKIDGKNLNRYRLHDFENVFERYLDPDGDSPVSDAKTVFFGVEAVQPSTSLPSPEHCQKLGSEVSTLVETQTGNFSQKTGEGREVETQTACAGQKEISEADYIDPAPATDAGKIPEFLDRRRVVTRI